MSAYGVPRASPIAAPSFNSSGQLRATYGRALSEITSRTSEEDERRKEAQRQKLVADLEEQMNQRQAAKLIESIRRWDDEQVELAAQGLRGAGKPRPTVPEHLVPYVRAQDADILHGTAFALHAYAAAPRLGEPGGGLAAARPVAPLSGHPSALAHTLPSVVPVRQVSAEPGPVASPRVSEVESRLDRLLAMATGQAPGRPVPQSAAFMPIESAPPTTRASHGGLRLVEVLPEEDEAGQGSGSSRPQSAGIPPDVGALTDLVRELLAEQRQLREAVQAQTQSQHLARGQGYVDDEEDTARRKPARGKGGRAETGRGSSAPPRRGPGSVARSEGPVSRPASAFEADGPPNRGGPPARLAVGRAPGRPAQGAARRDRERVEEQAAPPTARTGPPKRPAFGRHNEGQMTAAERRARGEARAAEAAQARRAALDTFREAEAQAKEAKRRDKEEQKQLRRALPYHRGAVEAETAQQFERGSPGLGHDMASPPRRGVAATAAGLRAGRQAAYPQPVMSDMDDRPLDDAPVSPGMMRYGQVRSPRPGPRGDAMALGSPNLGPQLDAGPGGSPATELQAESRFIFPEQGSPPPKQQPQARAAGGQPKGLRARKAVMPGAGGPRAPRMPAVDDTDAPGPGGGIMSLLR